MINVFKKIIQTIVAESRNRGLYFTVLMNISHVIGALRGAFYKVIYFRNIKCSIFFSKQIARLRSLISVQKLILESLYL